MIGSDQRTKGVRTGPPEVLKSLMEGGQPDPHDYDFHLHAFLETGDERYIHLDHISRKVLVVEQGDHCRESSAVRKRHRNGHLRSRDSSKII